jgi:hypothetical protein
VLYLLFTRNATQRRLPIIPIHSDAIPEPSCAASPRLSVDLNLVSTHAEEIVMKVITIGKRLVPAEQLAFVEPFDPSGNPEFKPEKDFKGRVVLLNREIVLTEQTPQEFALEHELHLFAEDNVAVNRAIRFKIETFEPTETFKPLRPYKTRLKWSDLAGDEQSKLLVTAPETVIAEILQAKTEPSTAAKRPARRQARGRSGSRRMEAFRN